MSQSRLTSGKANKREARTNKKQNETTNTQGSQTNSPKQKKQNKPRQQPKPQPQKRGGQKHQPGQRTTRQAGKTKHSGGAAGSRQAETRKQERTDAREGSRGRKEQATQAKVGACGFSGVQRGFWITRGQIPQRRSEGHMNNTHSMVERAKPHTGPKPLLHEAEGRHEPIATTRHAKGMTTGPSQIQPDTRREGPARLTGPESTRGQPRGREGGKTGKSRSHRKHPSRQNRQERRQQQRQNQGTATTKQKNPAASGGKQHEITRPRPTKQKHKQEMHGRAVRTQTHRTKECKQ